MGHERFVCTKDDPYTPEKAKPFNGRAQHPDAVCTGTTSDWYDGDDDDHYECPNCGTRFRVLIPR